MRPPPSTPPPPSVAPAAPSESEDARRDRLIAHLTEQLLGDPDEAEAAMPALVRLVRARDGSLDRLVTELERQASGPRLVAASMALSQLEQSRGATDAALRRARTVAETPEGARSPRVLLAYAELLRQAGQAEASMRVLGQAWAARAGAGGRGWSLPLSRDQQAMLLRAQRDAHLAQGRLTEARASHASLVTLLSGSASVRRELADALMSRQQYAEAVTEFESLARALAGDNRVLPPVLRDLGRAQVRAGRLDDGERTLRRALGLAGGDAGVRRELYDDLTDVFARRQQLPQWVAELERGGASTYERAMLLGRLHADQGHTTESLRSYQRALAMRPAEVDAHLAVIQLLSQSGQMEALLTARRRLVAAAPRNPVYVIDLADELVRAGRRDEALQTLRAASARAGNDPQSHERLALAFARLGEREAATRETELVARYDPRDAAALEAYGERLLEAGQREQALAVWARIREGGRDRARGAAALAEVYGRHDMAEAAIGVWREAITLSPREVDYHKGLATQLEAVRAYNEAVSAWRQVIALAQDDRELRREARARIINLWNVQQLLPRQVEDLARAFEAERPDLEAGRDLAAALVRLRRNEEAERVLSRLIALDRTDTDSLVSLERARAQRGDLAGAMESLRQLAELEPQRARTWYQRLAEHALALHHDQEAIDYAARALQLNPDDAQGHERLADLYRTRGDLDAAVASYRRALALDDRRFAVCFALADLLLVKAEPAAAIELYRRVIRLAPDDDLVRRAGQMATQIALAENLTDDLIRDLVTAAAAAPGRAVLAQLSSALFVQLGRPLVDTIRHGTPEASTRARAQLQRQGTRALKPLLDALAERDASVRRVALDILGALQNPDAIPALLTLAETEDSAEAQRTVGIEARQQALQAVALLVPSMRVAGAERTVVVTRLSRFLASGDMTLSCVAAWALSRVPGGAGVALLTAQVRDVRARAGARAMAVLALGAGSLSPAQVTLLRSIAFRTNAVGEGGAASQEDPGLVEGAAMAALGRQLGVADLPSLQGALRRGPFWVRVGALVALGRSTAVRTQAPGLLVPWIFSPLMAPPGDGALSLREVAATQWVRSLASGPDAWSQTWASHPWPGSTMLGFAALATERASTSATATVLASHRDDLARAAVEAFATPESRAVVLETLSSEHGFAAFGADEGTRPAVLAAVVDHALGAGLTLPPAQRVMLARLYGERTEARATEGLVALARDGQEEVVLAAMQGLRGRSVSVETLVTLGTGDVSSRVRAMRAELLGGVVSAESTRALIEMAQRDRASVVRLRAIEALVPRAGEPTVRSALAAVARDEADPEVRRAVTSTP